MTLDLSVEIKSWKEINLNSGKTEGSKRFYGTFTLCIVFNIKVISAREEGPVKGYGTVLNKVYTL